LGRSREDARKRRRRLFYYFIPIIALALSVSVYAVGLQPKSCQTGSAVMSYGVQISIQYAHPLANGTNVVNFIVPSGAGEAGLAWNTHTFDSNGLDCKYPLYMDPPTNPYRGYSLINVVSNVYHNYTLGDFFAVWGMTLGQNNTINQPAANGYYWWMCVGPSQSLQRPGAWGAEPLVNYNSISLKYGNEPLC